MYKLPLKTSLKPKGPTYAKTIPLVFQKTSCIYIGIYIMFSLFPKIKAIEIPIPAMDVIEEIHNMTLSFKKKNLIHRTLIFHMSLIIKV